MPTDLFTRKPIDSSKAIPVIVRGKRIGSVSPEAYADMDEPDYLRMSFDVPEEEGEEEDEGKDKEE